MSSQFEAGSESSLKQITPYTIVRDAWSELLSRKVQALYDEDAPRSKSQRIGTRRRDLAISEGNLSIARYNLDYIPRAGNLMRELLGFRELTNPIGDIAFFKNLANARIGGAIFLTENEKTAGYVECSITPGEALGGDSDACYEFAEKLGISGSWHRAMGKTVLPKFIGEVYKESFILDEPAQLQLGESLQAIKTS